MVLTSDQLVGFSGLWCLIRPKIHLVLDHQALDKGMQ